jgi:anti-sigma factor ChrR (cupin superfamily)
MDINADFEKRVVLHADDIAWRNSPMPGVDRRPLDRMGDEIARATTIVRYAPGSQFSAHTHDGGEEFIVLEGIFQDEHGDFPAGTYVRNPPTSSHIPGSAGGCVIFVKLWQFDPADRTHVHIDMNEAALVPDRERPGIEVAALFNDAREDVRLERWAANTKADFVADGGAEIFVLEGVIEESGDILRRHSWVRIPIGGRVALKTGDAPARIWIKTGHLRWVGAPRPAGYAA